MKKLTPFLKLYTEYVKDMHRSSSLVNSYEEKSSAFATILKDAKVKRNNVHPQQTLKDYLISLPLPFWQLQALCFVRISPSFDESAL